MNVFAPLRRKIRLLWLAPVTLVAVVGAASAQMVSLPVPYHFQEKDNWCWNGCSQMLLEYYGVVVSQQTIADYAVGGKDVGTNLDGSLLRQILSLGFAQKGVGDVLSHFGNINSTYFSRRLSLDELTEEIGSNRPLVVGIAWYRDEGFRSPYNSGHAILLVGFDSSTNMVKIDDPEKDIGTHILKYDILSAGGTAAYATWTEDGKTLSAAPHIWDESLTLAAKIDLVFLIDSTGSMGSYIGQAKANAASLLDKLTGMYADYHVAVVDYKDMPPPDGPGSYGDYIDQVDTPFTRDKSTVLNAINSLSATGGGDTPEAAYSALCDVLEGGIIGGWRSNPTKRVIVLMGDAPGHDPVEPWVGGKSAADVLAKATAKGLEIQVESLLVGNSPLAGVSFQTIAHGSGGLVFNAGSSFDLPQTISNLVDNLGTRSPSGNVSAFLPAFSFSPAGGGMLGKPSKLFIELDKMDEKSSNWKLYKRVALPAITTQSWVPSSPLPQGAYRWRLNYSQKAVNIVGPDKKVISREPASTLVEDSFTEFTRLEVLPSDPALISPAASFTASTTSLTFSWGKATNASKYVVFIKKAGKLWKKVTVAPPAKNLDAPVLSLKVSGLTKGTAYSWRVESLNFDKPKPTE